MIKKQLLLTLMLMVCCISFAKDIKTLRVTTEPQMVCNNCENKIKKTIRFEKGIQEITTDLDNQVVTVVYDAEKTDEQKIVKAFEKMKYKATVLGDEAEGELKKCCKKVEGECKKAKGQCCKKAKGQCKKAEGQCKKAEGECCKKAEGECCKKAEGQCKKAEGECCKKAEGQCKKAEGECCKNKKK